MAGQSYLPLNVDAVEDVAYRFWIPYCRAAHYLSMIAKGLAADPEFTIPDDLRKIWNYYLEVLTARANRKEPGCEKH